ncbi:hypothetical protein BD289DRAFT_14747 [Coniella lustricola]|uniref:Uncharacterized protein n=1 Tax=Coniella lustricola TaxID=2025994 RepID=A0A2T3A420_9PEZI|nr:hypothetical protein BD289DRAFT_14747 [Coniella lustricola]
MRDRASHMKLQRRTAYVLLYDRNFSSPILFHTFLASAMSCFREKMTLNTVMDASVERADLSSDMAIEDGPMVKTPLPLSRLTPRIFVPSRTATGFGRAA